MMARHFSPAAAAVHPKAAPTAATATAHPVVPRSQQDARAMLELALSTALSPTLFLTLSPTLCITLSPNAL